MISAIERMNQSPQLRDVNVTLGYRIFDSCSDASTALRATHSFLHSTSHPTVAVIGGSMSEISIAVAQQLTLKMIPQVSLQTEEKKLQMSHESVVSLTLSCRQTQVIKISKRLC